MIKNMDKLMALFVLFLMSTIGVVDGAVNLISNPGFESGTTSWNFYASAGGTFTTPSPGYEGNNSAKIALSNAGTNIQLYQTPVAMEANTLYRLSFAAYSNTGHDMTVRLLKHVSPYTLYMPDFTVNLGTTWQTFSYNFTSSGFTSTVNDGRLIFWLAGFAAAGDTYYIDDIRLEKVVFDTNPPMVIGNTPTGTNISVNTKITITFSEAMNVTSVQSAFSTNPATTGKFSWNRDIMTYTLPGIGLSAGTNYEVLVGTGSKDLAGNNMLSPYSWQFTTASVSDTTPPIVIGSTPTGTNVPVNTQIIITFNESMDQISTQSAFSIFPQNNISWGFSWSGNIMTCSPASSLSESTTYTVTIGTGAKDLAGNSLQSPYSWSFTTSGGSSSIEARLAALEAENTALKNLLAGISRNGNDIYIDGANVHITDGSGSTDGTVNGLGNLIIGYNENRGNDSDRTGSHNIILGTYNNYKSYGGLVAGFYNEISGAYASVSGGNGNIASGEKSSVSGGSGNIASGNHSSVSGGNSNTASNYYSSVSGGSGNTASGNFGSSVSGGFGNNAYGDDSSVSGGSGNIASGSMSSVSGGDNNIASGGASSVSGGNSNTASSYYSSVSGGHNNTASGESSSVSGGCNANSVWLYGWTTPTNNCNN